MPRIRILFITALAVLALAVVGAVQASAQKTATGKLAASVGPGFTISFTQNGKKVKTLKAGTYKITVKDKSTMHNFHLFGHGINKKTVVSTTSTVVWNVKFVVKGTYRYHCDAHPTILFGSFKVK
jgi:plastocyanin